VEEEDEQQQLSIFSLSGGAADDVSEALEEENAMDWMLRKADESLDQIEENPPAIAQALYDLSNGPVGQL
jgi:hypothetical protein